MASDAPDAPIQMTATIKNSEIKYDLTQDSDWSCTESDDKENTICTQSWNVDQFNAEGETTFEEDNLVLKKQFLQHARLKTSITFQCVLKKVTLWNSSAPTHSKLQPCLILSMFKGATISYLEKVLVNSTIS